MTLSVSSTRTAIKAVERIVAARQVGAEMSPSGSPSERTACKVHSFEVNNVFPWTKPDCTRLWQFAPTDTGETRLVTPIHAVYDWQHPLRVIWGAVPMEFGDFVMLRSIKERAESLHWQTDRPPALGASHSASHAGGQS